MAERSPGERLGASPTSRRGFLRAASALGAAGLAVGVLGAPRAAATPLASVRGMLRGRVDASSAALAAGDRVGLALAKSGAAARLVAVSSAARFRSPVLPLDF